MPRIVGIDLGTTNSLVAVTRDDRPEILHDPETGSALLPSVVSWLPDGSAVVGATARLRAVTYPESTVASVKRFMGLGLEHLDADDRRQHRFVTESGSLRLKIGDGNAERTLAPPEISAMILRELKHRAERVLGEEVTRAVVTVPAYFNDSQRQATRDAGRIAGLEILRLVNEPTAAALAYGLDRRDESTIAVFDLGGGTFDISILQLRAGLFEVLATGGDTRLGGDDFDRRLAEILRARLALSDEAVNQPALREAAERSKRLLSDQDHATVEVTLPGGSRLVSVERAAFEEACADLIARSIELCRRALADAGKTTADIDEVVLVGGSTRVPAVRREVAAFFGRTPRTDIDPDEVVALGAAVQAGILSGAHRDVLLLDVVPLSLGIETMGGVLSRLIDRNTTIPAAAREQFTTAVDDQTHVEIHVLQGERELARDCRSLARFRIPIEPAPAGLPRVEVTFLIDANGILSVSARDERTNVEKSIEVKPSYGLRDEDIEQMIEESFDRAEEDFAARQLAEARIEAETLLHATRKAEGIHAELLSPDERAVIDRAAAELLAACADDDHVRIRDLVEALNEATTPLAQRIMDLSIQAALESRHVSEL